MPLELREKTAIVEDMTGRLGRATAVVMADYRGLNVTELMGLRRTMRASGAELHVIKNTLMRRACVAAGIEPPAALLSGPTAVALLYDDLSRPAKALIEFAKQHEVFAIKGGIIEGKAMDERAVKALADLPSRDELRAMLLSVFQAPQRQLVTVLAAPMRDFVSVLHNYAEKGEKAAA